MDNAAEIQAPRKVGWRKRAEWALPAPPRWEIDALLAADRLYNIKCSEHAWQRASERVPGYADLTARAGGFLCEDEVRACISAGQWSRRRPLWVWRRRHRRPLINYRTPRERARWCWDAERSHAYLIVWSRGNWVVITCHERNRFSQLTRWPALLNRLQGRRNQPPLPLVALSVDGELATIQMKPFAWRLSQGQKSGLAGALNRHQAQPFAWRSGQEQADAVVLTHHRTLSSQLTTLVLDFSGLPQFDDDILLRVLTPLCGKVTRGGTITLIGQTLPARLTDLLWDRHGLCSVPPVAGESARLQRGWDSTAHDNSS